MKTHYLTIGNLHARYWYDTHLRLWTAHEVTQPNEDGDQIGGAFYDVSRKSIEADIRALALIGNEVAA